MTNQADFWVFCSTIYGMSFHIAEFFIKKAPLLKGAGREADWGIPTSVA